ncbi:DUF2637 domain-containing protein [Actinomadura sp. GTD37]|uniref:DUF2637 domain-containing protein n=1 Tax=Actinomadura sp. GTD37 TaxID=1778030 RepID=UPI0035C14A09
MTIRADRGRTAAYALALALGFAVAAVGYISSYDNLSSYASAQDWAWGPALPIGLDLGIPALLILDWLRASVFLRSAAWALALGTVAANGAVADGDWKDRALHAVMPALAILIIEAARHLRDDPARMDKIRLSRWLLSPVRTARLWRRMVLWEITSYSDALTRESAILHARTVLAAHYGRRSWWRTRRLVPLTLTHLLATGQLPVTVLHSLDAQESVQAWVQEMLATLDPAPVPVQAVAEETGPDTTPDPDKIVRDRWDAIWVRQDSIRPDGVPAEVFASAIAIARREFEQAGTHITNEEMRTRLKIAKPRADATAKAIRSAFQSGPVRPDQTPDSAPGVVPAAAETAGPLIGAPGPAGPDAGLNGHPVAVRVGGGES